MGTAANLEVDLDGLFLENTPYHYEDYKNDDGDDEFQILPVFIPVLYSLALITGLLGNGLALAVLCRLRRAWSVTDIFILHLSVADTLLLVPLPLWAAEAAQGWSFGTPVCCLTGTIFKTSFFCRVLLLACMSVDRYLSIARKVQMCRQWKPRDVQTSFLFVWLLCLLFCIPDWISINHQGTGPSAIVMCSFSFPEFSLSAHISRWLYHTIGFVLPSIVMVFCSSFILVQLLHSSPKLRKQRAVWLILVQVLAFLLCWMPFNLTLIRDTVLSHLGNRLLIPLTVTAALGIFHSSVNPVLYICFCRNVRHHTLHMLRLCDEEPPNQNLSLWEDCKTVSEENGRMCPQKSMEQTCC